MFAILVNPPHLRCIASVFVRKLIELIAAKYRAILADIFGTDIAAAAFSDTALHAQLQRRVD